MLNLTYEKNYLRQWIVATALRAIWINAVTHWLFKYSCKNPTIWCGDKSKKFQITTLLVAIDHDYNLHSPSKLVDVGCEVLLDEPPHKVCLRVHFQPLHLISKTLNNFAIGRETLRYLRRYLASLDHLLKNLPGSYPGGTHWQGFHSWDQLWSCSWGCPG